MELFGFVVMTPLAWFFVGAVVSPVLIVVGLLMVWIIVQPRTRDTSLLWRVCVSLATPFMLLYGIFGYLLGKVFK